MVPPRAVLLEGGASPHAAFVARVAPEIVVVRADFLHKGNARVRIENIAKIPFQRRKKGRAIELLT
jgi:hypothetical protein